MAAAFTYALNAAAIGLVMILIFGGLVGAHAALTVGFLRRGMIDQERALRRWRVDAVALGVLGLIAGLTPVQAIVAGRGLTAGGAGLIGAGVLMAAASVIGHGYFSQRIDRV